MNHPILVECQDNSRIKGGFSDKGSDLRAFLIFVKHVVKLRLTQNETLKFKFA